jgi:hypothetical protein
MSKHMALTIVVLTLLSYGVLLWEIVTTEVPTRGNLREVSLSPGITSVGLPYSYN